MFWIRSSVIGFCGVNIFILFEGQVNEKLWVFPQRIWIFKEEFRVAVYTTVIDNLESQKVKGVYWNLGPSKKVLFMQKSF